MFIHFLISKRYLSANGQRQTAMTVAMAALNKRAVNAYDISV
jgi:hypothetical protein